MEPTRCLRVEKTAQFFGGGVLGSNCCAMSLFVIKGRLRKEQARELKEEILDPIKELREGRGTIPGTDIPLIVPLQFVDAATLHEVLRGGDLKHLRGENNQPII